MMRRQHIREIWPEGRDEAPAVEALQAHAEASEAGPWPIQLLVGAGAWISALLLMIFTLMILDGDEGAQALGIAALIGGVALRRSVDDAGIFLTQLSLSLSLAGHALIVGPTLGDGPLLAATALIIISGVTLLAFPHGVHRFLSAVMVILGVAWAAYEVIFAPWAFELVGVLTAAALAATFEWEVRWQRGPYAALQAPVGFGLAAALALLSLPSLFPQPDRSLIGATAGLCLVLAAVVWRAARDLERPPSGARAAALWAAILLPVIVAPEAPGIVAAALAMVLGLRRAHPALFYGALIFGVVFIFGWYRNMDLPLMQKAGALVGLGVGVLLLRVALLRGEGGS